MQSHMKIVPLCIISSSPLKCSTVKAGMAGFSWQEENICLGVSVSTFSTATVTMSDQYIVVATG